MLCSVAADWLNRYILAASKVFTGHISISLFPVTIPVSHGLYLIWLLWFFQFRFHIVYSFIVIWMKAKQKKFYFTYFQLSYTQIEDANILHMKSLYPIIYAAPSCLFRLVSISSLWIHEIFLLLNWLKKSLRNLWILYFFNIHMNGLYTHLDYTILSHCEHLHIHIWFYYRFHSDLFQ